MESTPHARRRREYVKRWREKSISALTLHYPSTSPPCALVTLQFSPQSLHKVKKRVRRSYHEIQNGNPSGRFDSLVWRTPTLPGPLDHGGCTIKSWLFDFDGRVTS